MGQMNVFTGEDDGEGTSEPLEAAEGPFEAVPVPREPGWVLVASRTGPKGHHRIRTVGALGSLVTVCGVTGRKVEDSQRLIMRCVECRDSS
jgi:hypothetical protein